MPLRKMNKSDIKTVATMIPSVERSWNTLAIEQSLLVHQCWIFEKNLKVSGFVIISHVADEAEILYLAVESKLQQQGVGKAMLQSVMAELKKSQVRRVFLEVRASNKVAQMLYKHCRLLPMSRRQRYYPSESGREDAIVYSCIF